MAVVMMRVVVGVVVRHGWTLYYNITGVHALERAQDGLIEHPARL
jgi:hypothetical protein